MPQDIRHSPQQRRIDSQVRNGPSCSGNAAHEFVPAKEAESKKSSAALLSETVKPP
jgi:hypothetical protein